MRFRHIIPLLSVIVAVIFSSCRKESRITMSLPEKFEGKKVELISYSDSSVVATADVKDGKVEFLLADSLTGKGSRLLQVMVDGRLRAYCVSEEGRAEVSDSTGVAVGTPLNDRFATMIARLDSIENLNDMPIYLAEVERLYTENRDNVLSQWFGVEWIKYAEPSAVDSMLAVADPSFKQMPKVRQYAAAARLRAATAQGSVYKDFNGETVSGRKVSLSKYVLPGNYTIVDFWASWCPYCIKEIPELADLYARRNSQGVEIVGVAVRDNPEDTRAMVEKKNIPWKILYNTGRTPYDIYGFSGIPHLMLIGPDGRIISRGESVASIDARLETLLSEKSK